MLSVADCDDEIPTKQADGNLYSYLHLQVKHQALYRYMKYIYIEREREREREINIIYGILKKVWE
jgi:hypothetical protein